jgi:signal transduction histidine kinase
MPQSRKREGFIKYQDKILPMSVGEDLLATWILNDEVFLSILLILGLISILVLKKARSYSKDLEVRIEEITKELTLTRDSLSDMIDNLKNSKHDLANAYDELKDLDRLKTFIIANISHELRTPITIAKSSIELAREEIKTKEKEKFLSMCEDALLRLNDIVENLVEISDIYRGYYVPTSEFLDLKSLISDILQDYGMDAKKRKIKLRLNSKDGLPNVIGDKKALSRVLANLIENAIKFNREEGEVEIEVLKVGEFIHASIRDTGVGIPEQYLDKIFEPFYQVDPSTTRKFGGTGIGLAVVRALIETQKGQVWVESKLGEYSIFFIKLPIAKEKDL